MGVYFRVGQVITESVKPDDKVLVAVPGAVQSCITTSYASQIAPGNHMVMMLGNSKQAASYLLPSVQAKLQEDGVLDELEARAKFERLAAELDGLTGSSAGRADLFWKYAWEGGAVGSGFSSIREQIQRGELSRAGLTAVVSAVYDRLRREKGATSALKEQMRSYIRSGEADDNTVNILAAVSPVFEKLAERASLARKLQQIGERGQHATGDLSELEHALVGAVAGIKSGASCQQGFEFNDFGLNVYEILKQLLSAEPGKYLLCEISEAVQGQNRTSLLVPFTYTDLNAPEKVSHHLNYSYLPPQRLTQLITVLDRALSSILIKHTPFSEVLPSQGNFKVSDALLVRSLMPENPAIRVLYPPERVDAPKSQDLARKIAEFTVECFKNGRIAGLASEHLMLSEGELRFGLDRLVGVLNQVMPILPLEVYEHVSLNDQFDELRKQGTPSEKRSSMARKLVRLIETLRDRFGIDVYKMLDFDEQTKEEAIRLFGQELEFIRKVPRLESLVNLGNTAELPTSS